jgi:phosphatidate cytidylyltransferase
MLKNRVITALWAIPLVLAAIWFNTPIPWFVILAGVVAVIGVYEFYRITGVAKSLSLTIFGVIFAALFIVRAYYPDTIELSILLAAGVGLSLAVLIFLPKEEGLYARWAYMVGGALYVGFLLSFLAATRLEPGTATFPNAGRDFVYLTLLATFGSDTAAYFVGRAIGRHKMAPSISPGKTWEGAAAGVIGGMLVAWLFTLPTPLQVPLNWWQAILLGLLVSAFGQVGDLAESLLKRNCGVKDSGALMPGHGGILDRLDSVLFAGVVVYLWYIWVVL